MNKSKHKSRLLILLLATIIMIMQMPFGAFAAGDVAVVNNQRYNNLSTAWNRVKNGGTITFIADCKVDDQLIVEKNAVVTVNLGGHILDRDIATTKYNGTGEGQIFFVKSGATLTINGGEAIKHTGYVDGDLWFSGTKSGKKAVVLTGGVLTGGGCDDHDGAGAITLMDKTKVTLNNVNIAGNVSDCFWGGYGQGGAIRLHEEDATLTLNHCKIMYNHAEDDGGAIYVEDVRSTVNLIDSEISHNYAAGDGGGIYSNDAQTAIRLLQNSSITYNSAKSGGGIYMDYSKFGISSQDSSAVVAYNTARSGHGGGIYVEHRILSDNYGSIYGLNIHDNTAVKYGGGIYLDQENIVVSNCKVTNNTANYGGGIYLDNDAETISDCTITNNLGHKSGGGVFSSANCDPALSGKVIIKDNRRDDGTKDDLYLNDATFTSYLIGSPSGQSEVGIRTEKKQERKLGKEAVFYYEDAFFSDLGDDYHIEFHEDDAELWIKAGKKEIVVDREVSPNATKVGTYNGLDLIYGYFSFPSVIESQEDGDTDFFYSDGFFLNGADGNNGDPTLYNPHLATMSMVLAMAGFYSSVGNDGTLTKGSDRKYTYKSQNIEKLFADIGIESEDIFISDSNTVKPLTDSIGVAIGQKEIGSDGEILVAIAVRGSGYESEWYGNTTVGLSGEHEGFAIAANQVFEHVQNYIEEYGLTEARLEGKLKFWIAGYSRAGATSNLTAKRLIEEYCSGSSPADSNQVYAYCFEAPKGGMNSELELSEEKYFSIHNCINKVDIVPLVAPEEMGFIRYGVDHYVPGQAEAGAVTADTEVWSFVRSQPWASKYKTWYDNTSWTVGSDEYNAQRSKMLAQLNTVDAKNIYFYDRFEAANIEYMQGGAFSFLGFDLIQGKGKTSMNQEMYIQLLVRELQAWGFYRCYTGDFRSSYASGTMSGGGATFEEALQVLTKIFFAKDANTYNGMMTALSATQSRLGIFDELDIYDDLIGDWCDLTDDERAEYMDELWEVAFEEKGPDGFSALDFLNDDEIDELKDAWYTLADVMLRFVSADYKFDAEDWNKSHAMVKDSETGTYKTTPITEGIGDVDINDCQVALGTLAYNSTAITQAHYPEINLSWLRSYDSFYDDKGNSGVKIVNTQTPVVTGSVSEDGTNWTSTKEHYEETQYLKLEADIAGAGVYYRIKEENGEFSDWKPYNKPVELRAHWSEEMTYTVEYTSIYCGKISNPAQMTFKMEQKT